MSPDFPTQRKAPDIEMDEPLPLPAQRWLDAVHSGDADAVEELLAPEVEFFSPAVHGPKQGAEITGTFLRAAVAVLGPTWVDGRHWSQGNSAVLEFKAEIDGLSVQGVDILEWNNDGKITSFTVMARPLRGLSRLSDAMGAALKAR